MLLYQYIEENKFKMGNTPSDIVDPQKGFEEVKVLQSKTLASKSKLHRVSQLLHKARRIASVRLIKARGKVRKLQIFELKLKKLDYDLDKHKINYNIKNTQRKNLAEKTKKIQSGLRKAREAFDQAEKYFNVINEKQQKIVEKLESLSS